MRCLIALTACAVLGLASLGEAGERLTVHEWGTFTSFQNELGETLHRINTDDEPVPPFVHQMGRDQLFSATDVEKFKFREEQFLTQGAPAADPHVTMRLETPVLYFYLPPGEKAVSLDVSVSFKGGLLTQFFPKAEAKVDGKVVANYDFPRWGAASTGTLRWTGVRVGEAGEMPQTTDRVWLAPRKVASVPLKVGQESEQFLFYRGVGELAAPLRVIRHADQILELRAPRTTSAAILKPNVYLPHVWLLDVRPDGTSAFLRILNLRLGQDLDSDHQTYVPGKFAEPAFAKENLSRLRGEMQNALESEGLFADEATALLNTWELSYFLSPGQRLFFFVPSAWTNAVLPLKLSVPADVKRVMVGRIELVTPRHRELLQQIGDSPASNLTAVLKRMQELKQDTARREEYNALASGRGDSSVLGIPVPSNYQAFLDLGRFRTSLLMDSAERQARAGQRGGLNRFHVEMLYPGEFTSR